MKNPIRRLLGGAAVAVLACGLFSVGSFAADPSPTTAAPKSPNSVQPQQLPPDLMQFFRFVMPSVSVSGQPASDDDLVKNISPKASDALGKLTPEERTKALSESKDAIKSVFARPDIQDQLRQMPADKQPAAVHDIWSDIVSTKADVKYNYCNVMLDMEAGRVYSEDGLKKLNAVVRACPANVTLEKTLEYVNQTLACTIGDPAYTRVVAPEEYGDMRKQTAGTKTAFKGGGIGLKLSGDPSKTLPLTADQKTAYDANKAAIEAERAKINPCTGKSFKDEMTTDDIKAEADYKPSRQAFTGLIFHVVKGSPSDKAGLQDGDVITKVDGMPVTGLDSDFVVDKMRGAVGTNVDITFMRGSKEDTKTITREPVLPDTVWSRDLGNGIYAIVIESFERNNTAFQIYDEVKKLQPKAKGFVFDVRNNPGGLLDEAIEAVSWFVHDGVILSQRERVEGDANDPQYLKITWSRVGTHVLRETVDEKSGKVLESGFMTLSETDDQTGEVHRKFTEIPFLGTVPMVVLANDHSASAAEIFTGGMSENFAPADKSKKTDQQGATFIGVHTYGKFIGQAVGPGPLKTAIKATTFRYFSPKGEWLGDAWKVKIGLKANIEVKQPDNAVPYTASDAQLNFAKAYLVSGGTAKPPVAAVSKP